jgi:hypothetical protein
MYLTDKLKKYAEKLTQTENEEFEVAVICQDEGMEKAVIELFNGEFL